MYSRYAFPPFKYDLAGVSIRLDPQTLWHHRRFDHPSGSLDFPSIVGLMRHAVSLPRTPCIPTFDLYGRSINAFTLTTPPSTRRADINIGPVNPQRQKWIRRAPPSPAKSEDRWSTAPTIGKGKKYEWDSAEPTVVGSSVSATGEPERERYVLCRTTHHRSSQRTQK